MTRQPTRSDVEAFLDDHKADRDAYVEIADTIDDSRRHPDAYDAPVTATDDYFEADAIKAARDYADEFDIPWPPAPSWTDDVQDAEDRWTRANRDLLRRA